MSVSRDGVRAGHHTKREGIGGQEFHDVLLLNVRSASEVDKKVTQILPVAGDREKERRHRETKLG